MRLEGQIKKGFYPLPMQAVPEICRVVSAHPKATIYDPCCGEGVAVKAIADGLAIPPERIYAAELDAQRSQKAAELLQGSTVYQGADFLSDSVWGNPSIVYCNPPFADELGGGRSERVFFSRCLHIMEPGAIAIFVAPLHQAIDYTMWEVLSCYLRDITIHRVPEPCKYGEAVIIGVRRKINTQVDWSGRVRSAMTWDEAISRNFTAPPGAKVTHRKQSYTDAELQALASSSTANAMLEIQSTAKERAIRPPMELTHGHVALLLASGYLDGVVAKPGELPHVVRGSTKKVVEVKTEKTDTGSREIQVEHIQLTVKVATLNGVIQLNDRLQTEAEEGETTNV